MEDIHRKNEEDVASALYMIVVPTLPSPCFLKEERNRNTKKTKKNKKKENTKKNNKTKKNNDMCILFSFMV